jgi:O-antigen ligase
MRWLAVGWVFALVLGLSAYTQDPSGPIKWLLSSGLALLMALVACVDSLRRGRITLGHAPVKVAMVLFALLYVIAALFSEWPWHAFYAMAPWLSGILFALLLPQACRSVREIEQVLVAAVFAIALSSVYGLCQRYGLDPFPWSTRDRYEYTGLPSTYGHPNFAGHVLIVGIILAVGLSWYVPGWKRPLALRVLLLGCAALMLTHLHFTGMRAGWLALGGAVAAVAGAMMIKRFLRRGEAYPAVTLSLGAVLAMAAVLGLAFALHRWPETKLFIDSSWLLRLNGWLGATELFFDHPLGTGPGSFREAIVPYWTDFEQRWFILYNQRNNHAHNELLEAAVEAGVPGVLATLTLFVVALHAALRLTMDASARARRLGWMCFAAVTAFLIDAQFGFNLHTVAASGFIFLLLGALLAAHTGNLSRLPCLSRMPSLAMTAAALLLFGVASTYYYAEWKFQRSMGARQWAETLRNSQPELAASSAKAALEEMEAACRMPFVGPRHWNALAQARAQQEQPGPAADAYREALARTPFDPSLLAHAAHHLLDAFPEDPAAQEEAFILAQRAVTFCPGLAEAEHALGRVKLAEARRDKVAETARATAIEAAEHLRMATRNARAQDADIWLRLIDACEVVGDERTRDNFMEAAVRAIPESPALWERYEGIDVYTSRSAAERLYERETNREFSSPLLSLPVPTPDYLPDLAARGVGRAARHAVLFFPERLDLWRTAVVEPQSNWMLLTFLLDLREKVGACDPVREEMLAPLYQLLDSMEARDAAGIERAIGAVSNRIALLTSAGDPSLQRAWGWIPSMLELNLESLKLGDVEAASVRLGIAGLYRQLDALPDAAVMAGMAEPWLSGTAQGAAHFYLSLALAGDGEKEAALSQALRASALAPHSPDVRLQAARCLRDAGRRVEAEFEYMTVLGRLAPGGPEHRSVAMEYESLKGENPAPEASADE